MLTAIKITVDASIRGDEEDLQNAMLAILKEAGENLYGQLALVSKYPPTIKIEIADETFGTRNVTLFNT
jgi:hypothetical protein